MKSAPFQLNLCFAWLWILMGFLSGMVLGCFFNREQWLGGYGSWRRRMYRLGHISFFGLGAANLLFYFTAVGLTSHGALLGPASMLFVCGAISMPICCVLMAHFPNAKMLFAIPVISLLAGGALILLEVIKL
jgi:hypothetical protein